MPPLDVPKGVRLSLPVPNHIYMNMYVHTHIPVYTYGTCIYTYISIHIYIYTYISFVHVFSICVYVLFCLSSELRKYIHRCVCICPYLYLRVYMLCV